jgi:hypothetical protein
MVHLPKAEAATVSDELTRLKIAVAAERVRAIGVLHACLAHNRPGDAAGFIASGVSIEAVKRALQPDGGPKPSAAQAD